jgi:hypothetical protein
VTSIVEGGSVLTLAALLAALCSDLHHIATHKSNKISSDNKSFPIPKLDVAGSIPVSRSTQAKEITNPIKSVGCSGDTERELTVRLASNELQCLTVGPNQPVGQRFLSGFPDFSDLRRAEAGSAAAVENPTSIRWSRKVDPHIGNSP